MCCCIRCLRSRRLCGDAAGADPVRGRGGKPGALPPDPRDIWAKMKEPQMDGQISDLMAEIGAKAVSFGLFGEFTEEQK